MKFHKHNWSQIKDVFITSNTTKEVIGVYLFCSGCHAVCGVELKECPRWSYEKNKKDVIEK